MIIRVEDVSTVYYVQQSHQGLRMWAVEICNISSIIKIITKEIRPRVSQMVSSPLFPKFEMCPSMAWSMGQGRRLPGGGHCSAGALLPMLNVPAENVPETTHGRVEWRGRRGRARSGGDRLADV